MRNHRTQGLFGDRLRQDGVGGLVGERRAERRQLRPVVGEGVALFGLIGGDHRVGVLERQRADVQAVLVREVLEVQLRRRALGHADARALEFQRAADAQILPHQEALAVVEHRLGVVAPLGVARRRPRNRADEHVHLARLDGRPALCGGDQANLDGVRIAQNRCGERSAQVDVKPGVVARFVQIAVAGHVVAARANDLAPALYGLQAGLLCFYRGAPVSPPDVSVSLSSSPHATMATKAAAKRTTAMLRMMVIIVDSPLNLKNVCSRSYAGTRSSARLTLSRIQYRSCEINRNLLPN